MRTLAPWIAGAVAVVVLLMWAQGCDRDRRTRYEAIAEAALAEAATERARADRAEALALAEGRRADSTQARADTIAIVRTRLVERIDTVEIPAEAIPFTAPRDTIIDLLTEEVGTLRSALSARASEARLLREANVDLTRALARLEETLAARPRPRSRLWPTVGVGAFAGMCSDFQPCSGAGLTLSWSLSF